MPTKLPVRVVVVDDNDDFRGLLVELLDHVEGVAVVGQGCSGEAAGSLVRALRPDVAILDLGMPVTGWAAMESVRRARPATRVIVLTAMDERARHAAARDGADAVVSKLGPNDFVAETVRAVARITRRPELVVPKPSS
jgi:DNA-binding NarL/FixJ family response regulator